MSNSKSQIKKIFERANKTYVSHYEISGPNGNEKRGYEFNIVVCCKKQLPPFKKNMEADNIRDYPVFLKQSLINSPEVEGDIKFQPFDPEDAKNNYGVTYISGKKKGDKHIYKFDLKLDMEISDGEKVEKLSKVESFITDKIKELTDKEVKVVPQNKTLSGSEIEEGKSIFRYFGG